MSSARNVLSVPPPAHWEQPMRVTVYVDFDGTIAPGEPTDTLMERFAEPSWREVEDLWQAGRITSRECLSRQVAMLRATPAEIDAYLESIEIDPAFPDFVRLCRREGASLIVVSDGLDRVVGSGLRNGGLPLPFFANQLNWLGGDRWGVSFPYSRKDCRAKMASCKCSHRRSHEGSCDVMVGDGRSDFCIAERCSLVLAKGKLATHCERKGLRYEVIRDFADAADCMQNLFEEQRVTPVAAR